MAANKEVLKEFLVALGFQVDIGGLKMFMGTLIDTSTAAGRTTMALGGLMAAAEETVRTVSNRLEKLYYASKRTGESARNIDALSYGFEQIGLQADQAQATVESFSRAVRLNPGFVGLLKGLGVRTDNGPVAMLHDFIEQMSKMPPYQAAAYAHMFNIDPDTLQMLMQGKDALWKAVEAQLAMNKALSPENLKNSQEYSNSLRNLAQQAENAQNSLGTKLLPAFQLLTAYIGDTALPAMTKYLEDSIGRIERLGITVAAIMNHDWKTLKDLWIPSKEDLLKSGASFLKGMPGFSTMLSMAPGAQSKAPASGNQSAAPTSSSKGRFADLENKYGLPDGVLDRMWSAESNRGQNMGPSSAGARGHFQFMPKTQQEYGLKDPYDLASSAQAAAEKLHDLLRHYKGDVTKAIAGYNWGEGNLDKYGLGAAPSETKGYIQKVLGGGDASRNVTQNNNTTINVSGSGDPKATGDAVLNGQTRVFSLASRLAQSKVN